MKAALYTTESSLSQLTAVYNGIKGVKPIKKFTCSKAEAIAKIEKAMAAVPTEKTGLTVVAEYGKKTDKRHLTPDGRCPECGTDQVYAGRTNKKGLVVDEEKIFGCHECDWESDLRKSSGPSKAGPRTGVCAWLTEQLSQGEQPKDIFAVLHKHFPDAKTSLKAVYWMRSHLKQQGVL